MPLEPILEAPLDAFGEVNINVIKLQPMVCSVNRCGPYLRGRQVTFLRR